MNVYFSYLIDCIFQTEMKKEESLFPDDYLRFWTAAYSDRKLFITFLSLICRSSFEQYQQNLVIVNFVYNYHRQYPKNNF